MILEALGWDFSPHSPSHQMLLLLIVIYFSKDSMPEQYFESFEDIKKWLMTGAPHDNLNISITEFMCNKKNY